MVFEACPTNLREEASGLDPEAVHMLNGYTFEYGDEIRALLHRFATDEAAVDTDTAVIYFRACARRNS